MTTNTAFVLTLLVLCYAVVSGLVKQWYLAPALIFVLCGMALGPFGFDLLEGGTNTSTFTRTASVWHAFTLAASATKTIMLVITPTNAGGGDLGNDIDLYLETVGGAPIAQSAHSGTTTETIGPIVLGPGRYLVRAQAQPGHHAQFAVTIN